MEKLMSQWDVFVAPRTGKRELADHEPDGSSDGLRALRLHHNLPQAIMFTGGVYDEAAPLRVALAYEQATKWHTMHPKVEWA